MGDLQATVEFLVELYKFYNVDLFIRGYYQFRLTFKPPKSSHAIQVEVCEGHGERGAFTLFPAFVANDGQTAVSRTFNIYYKDEEVLLKDVFLFRVHLLIDSTKAADCIDKTALEMTVDVHFTDQVVRESNYRLLPLVTSRTLKFHFSCFSGLHHQVPLLFDYYYFSVLDLIVHANVVSLGLPNWSILKQIKTGWFSKSTTTPRSSTPLFYGTLFGNRSQFYSDPTLRYVVSNSSSISKEHFEKASAIHRNLCAILAMAHSQLLNYFDEMMRHFDEKQIIKLGEKLDPADLVEGLCKKLETLQSCEQVFDEMCSDLSVLNNELALLWLQFQESFTLNDQIRPVLREQHHRERMMHFSEGFFVNELPWTSLLNATDSSFQKHLSMGQCVKSSRYISMIPAVAVECAEVDGDSSSTPIFFEDRYVNKKDPNVEIAHSDAVRVRRGSREDDILEHKSLSLGILNKAFNDLSPQVTDSAGSSDFDPGLDAREVWVDIKTGQENDVDAARVPHAEQDESKISQSDDKGLEGIDAMIRGYNTVFQDLKAKPDTDPISVDKNSTIPTNKDTNNDDDKNILGKNCCLTETRRNIEPNLSIDCKENSLENLTKNVKDSACETQGSRENCGTMLGTKDSEVRDVSDIIPIIDTMAEEQPKKPGAEFVSVVDPSSIAGTSQESGQNSKGTVVYGGALGTDLTSGDNEGSLGSSVVQNQTIGTIKLTNEKYLVESGISTCLKPNTNLGTTVKNLETVKNDNSLESANRKVNGMPFSDLDDQGKQNKITLEDVSSNDIIPGCPATKEIDKKTSSVQYVRPSDTTAGNCSEFELNSENVSSISAPGTSAEVVQSDKVTGNDSTINRLRNDETTTLLNFAKKSKTEVTSKEPEYSHLNNSSSKQTLENTSDITGSSNNSNPSSISSNTGDHSGSKAHNTSQILAAKRVSNSVFYEGVSIIDLEENNSKEESENKEILDTLDTVRLSSNSSADVISCFCGGKLMKTSSPYRPTRESETSNSMLQKAKHDVISRMNYCGTLYSDFNTEFLVPPYFLNPKPDLSSAPIHFVVCVHGLEGNSGDLRLLRCFLEMALPSTKFEFLMSEVNQDNTFVTFEKLTEKLVSEILHNMEAYRIQPTRISFIGHSLGNIIIRSVLNHPLMEPYVELFHTFLSLSGPHLGMAYHTSSLVSTGMWLLQKWKKSDSLLQLSLNDSTDMRDTFIYKLSQKKGLEHFTNVLLVSSVQDHYVPFHSSRIELPKSLRSNSQECIVFREMMENLLTPLLSQPDRSLVRYSVYHCLPSSTNTFIGRAAHIAMLDSELFIEKLICTSAAKYFQ